MQVIIRNRFSCFRNYPVGRLIAQLMHFFNDFLPLQLYAACSYFFLPNFRQAFRYAKAVYFLDSGFNPGTSNGKHSPEH
jgi:hypothetical protein